MNKLLAIFILIFAFQSYAYKIKKNIVYPYQENYDQLTGNLLTKFDNDNTPDSFKILKNNDDIAQSVLSIYLSSLQKEIKFKLLNNSVLYNNKESAYYTFFTVNKNKICELVIQYSDQQSIPNISGEKKNLIEKIKLRYNSNKRKVQIIGYDLSYEKNKKLIKKHLTF